ncbi:hypothetical protein [Burkholderia alba]|uniref:hypothetical protein n=1 Tax=Burkholderia alba TaxID=2683677 RepID=UPI002B059A37|nr:hypothetical protein [Burkholderia alba]
MTLFKRRIADTDDKLKEMKDARKASDKARRHQVKQTRADRERKVLLIGEAILHRIDRGEMDEAEFRQIMEEALSRQADRALFGLDEDPSA